MSEISQSSEFLVEDTKDKKEKVIILPEYIQTLIDSRKFNVDKLSEIDPKYHPVIAEQIIEKDRGWVVVEYFDSFIGLDNQKIVSRLISTGNGNIVAENLDKFQGLDQAIAEQLIAARLGSWVAEYLSNFQGLDHNEIAQQLIEAGKGWSVASKIDNFQGLDHNKIAEQLIVVGEGYAVARNLDNFQGLDQAIAEQLIVAGDGFAVARKLEKFKGLDRNKIAERLIENRNAKALAEYLDKFQNLNQKTIRQLIEAGHGEAIIINFDKFKDLDLQKFVNQLIAMDQGYVAAKYLDKFQGLDHQKTAEQIIAAGEGHAVARNLEKFKGLDHNKIAQQLIAAGKGFGVVENLDKFVNLDNEVVNKLLALTLSRGEIKLVIEINEHFGGIDKILTKAYQNFGEQLSLEIYNIYSDLSAGNITEQAQTLGIKHPGETGINELKNRLRGLQRELLSGELDLPQLARDSEVARRFLMKTVRFEESQWGGHNEEYFLAAIENFQNLPEKYKGAPAEYIPSDVLNIAKIDKEKQDKFEFSEQFLSRYGTLMRSIKEAGMLADNPDAVSELQDITKQKRERLLLRLQASLSSIDNPKARENLEKRMADLKSLDLDKLTNPQDAFQILSSFKGEFDEELREFMFYWAFQFHPNLRQENLAEYDPNNPTLDQLSWSLNFIDHITNQETFKKYFTDKQARKTFDGLLNTAALQQELARWQNQDIKGTMSMQFIPSRDLLTEFSGHIGDACWASKYKSILEEFPNFISLTMVHNPGDPKHERLAGSAFLIETQSTNNEPILVIRGLNPQENVINQLDIADFYNNLVKYLKTITAQTKRKLAIVIDNHSGGSSTNRPNLFIYLNTLKRELTPVLLNSNEDTKFNGYDIRGDVYLV